MGRRRPAVPSRPSGARTLRDPRHQPPTGAPPRPRRPRPRRAPRGRLQTGLRERTRQLRKQQRSLPSKNPRDPAYRRLRYARYADDTLLGFTGPKAEAEEIKQRLGAFLRDDLKLELSEEKTLITHGRTGAARYLGYEITVHHDDRKLTHGRRSANGSVALRVPRDVIAAKCAPYLKLGKPEVRPHLVNDDDHTIVATMGRSTGAWSTITCWPVTSGD